MGWLVGSGRKGGGEVEEDREMLGWARTFVF
jgi:hypothetical protein